MIAKRLPTSIHITVSGHQVHYYCVSCRTKNLVQAKAECDQDAFVLMQGRDKIQERESENKARLLQPAILQLQSGTGRRRGRIRYTYSNCAGILHEHQNSKLASRAHFENLTYCTRGKYG